MCSELWLCFPKSGS